MSRGVFIFFIALAIVELSQSRNKNYDNFDIETVLSNPDRAKKFFECARNEATCSKEDKEMKQDLMEMLSTGCKNCTEAEKNKLDVIKRRAMNDPNMINMALGENHNNNNNN